jgi:N-acyl-D-aspartate/D-glutamate deacylase
MRLKGRVQIGCDADITVFDPAQIQDRATYEDTIRRSTGIAHVLVHGNFVVRDGVLLSDSMPGVPVYGRHMG